MRKNTLLMGLGFLLGTIGCLLGAWIYAENEYHRQFGPGGMG